MATRQIFNPTSPIEQKDLFSGGLEQVGDLLTVVHMRYYSEKGVPAFTIQVQRIVF